MEYLRKVKKKILLTRKLHDFAISELRKRYHVTIHDGKIPMPKKDLITKARHVDGLVCFPYDVIDGEVIEGAKNLRAISTYSVGYDHIDLESAKRRGIRVGYTPDVLTDATADLAMALVLDLLRRVTEGDRLIRAGKWKVIFGAYDYVGTDLRGKTLGIFGMGRIGQAVAKRASAFGMNVIYNSRRRLDAKTERRLGVRHVSFDRLVRKSDVLTVHVPYGRQTHQIIDAAVFKKMKRGAFLVNTARGRIVNEGDLVSALKSGTIAGAALDVFESEPIGGSHPLARCQNVVLAPHIGSSTRETRERMADIAVRNLVRGLEGGKMPHSVF